jgi:hypothetical protein
MIVAVDLDGTADAFPRELQSLMSAMQAAGHTVIVVTGTDTATIDPAEVDGKTQLLASLGMGQCYQTLVVIPGPEDEVADRKAAYLQSVNASVLIDNRKANCKAATKAGILALCTWGSKQ